MHTHEQVQKNPQVQQTISNRHRRMYWWKRGAEGRRMGGRRHRVDTTRLLCMHAYMYMCIHTRPFIGGNAVLR